MAGSGAPRTPSLEPERRQQLVDELMAARRAVAAARRSEDISAECRAHDEVDRAKHALGERGDPWWGDGAPDLDRHMARTTEYAQWYAETAGATGS